MMKGSYGVEIELARSCVVGGTTRILIVGGLGTMLQ
jgi:hypothetical protein